MHAALLDAPIWDTVLAEAPVHLKVHLTRDLEYQTKPPVRSPVKERWDGATCHPDIERAGSNGLDWCKKQSVYFTADFDIGHGRNPLTDEERDQLVAAAQAKLCPGVVRTQVHRRHWPACVSVPGSTALVFRWSEGVPGRAHAATGKRYLRCWLQEIGCPGLFEKLDTCAILWFDTDSPAPGSFDVLARVKAGITRIWTVAARRSASRPPWHATSSRKPS